jgi:hypothetical protein
MPLRGPSGAAQRYTGAARTVRVCTLAVGGLVGSVRAVVCEIGTAPAGCQNGFFVSTLKGPRHVAGRRPAHL